MLIRIQRQQLARICFKANILICLGLLTCIFILSVYVNSPYTETQYDINRKLSTLVETEFNEIDTELPICLSEHTVLANPTQLLKIDKYRQCMAEKNASPIDVDVSLTCLDTGDGDMRSHVEDAIDKGSTKYLPHIPDFYSPPLPKNFDISEYIHANNTPAKTPKGGIDLLKAEPPPPEGVVIARIANNALFPLHGVNYYSKSLVYTLTNEPIAKSIRVAKAKLDNTSSRWSVQRLWVVNRIANVTEKQVILHTLKMYKQMHYTIPIDFSLTQLARDKAAHILNIHNARLTAFREAVSLGGRWVVVTDVGYTFTEKGWRGIARNLLDAERHEKKIAFIPAYRCLFDDAQACMKVAEDDTLFATQMIRASPMFALRYDMGSVLRETGSVKSDHQPDPYWTYSEIVKYLVNEHNQLCTCLEATKLPMWALELQDQINKGQRMTMQHMAARDKLVEKHLMLMCGAVFQLPYMTDPRVTDENLKPLSPAKIVTNWKIEQLLSREAVSIMTNIVDTYAQHFFPH